MTRTYPNTLWLAVVALLTGVVTLAIAQQSSPSADDVRGRMLREAEKSPPIAPAPGSAPGRPGGRPASANAAPARGGQIGVDPRIVGVAPGGKKPTLRREGEFIITRRGRLKRAPNGSQMLFVFEADSEQSPEPPMILMPCQMLQNMEDMVANRGDKVVFIVSGQVYVYRGANQLLPTLMKPAFDRGNL